MDIISIEKARALNPVTLAFLGDGYYELLVRQKLTASGSKSAYKLHKAAVSFVCSKYQSEAADLILPLLNEAEEDIYRRGRNCNSNTVPRSSNPRDYRRATGVEALFGYLSLTGQNTRAEKLFEVIYNGRTEKEKI